MAASIRTLSQLPKLSPEVLSNEALFEVSQPATITLSGNNVLHKFTSRAIRKEDFSNVLINDVRENLKNNNGFYDEWNFTTVSSVVSAMGYGTFTFTGAKTFQQSPEVNKTLISSYGYETNSYDKYLVDFLTLKRYAAINSSPAIGPTFGFITQLSGKVSGSDKTQRKLNIFAVNENNYYTNEASFVFNQSAKKIASNEFVFKIDSGKRDSSVWTAPASGIFTCYGWLDEMNNPSQSNESRWVALMGRQAQLNVWTILQVQPFIKNNYLSYVGFTFPVKKGMELKITTGFSVGSNSDKYFNSSSSLANHIPNAFLGGIYTGLSADNGQGGNYDFDNIPTNYITSADLSDYVTRQEEDECDLSTRNLIFDLSAKISGDGDSSITNDYTLNYIDTEKLSSTNVSNGGMRYGLLQFGNSAAYNGSKYSGQADYSYFYIGNKGPASEPGGIIYQGHPYKFISESNDYDHNDPQLLHINTKNYRRVDSSNGGGNHFWTDDYFWYYTVDTDSMVNIIANPDYASSPRTGIQVYLRYLSADGTPMFKMIGSAVEYGDLTDNLVNETLPLKKGSTIAFAAFTQKQRTYKDTAWGSNFTGRTYATSNYKLTKTATLDGGTATAETNRQWREKTWQTLATINLANGNSIGAISFRINSFIICANQTAGKCNCSMRIIDGSDSSLLWPAEHAVILDANSRKTQTNTYTTSVLTAKNGQIKIQVAYNDGQAGTCTTQFWIQALNITLTSWTAVGYDASKYLGTSMPTFNVSKVQTIIDEWKTEANLHGSQLIEPHNRPSWITYDGVNTHRTMAYVTMMGLTH